MKPQRIPHSHSCSAAIRLPTRWSRWRPWSTPESGLKGSHLADDRPGHEATYNSSGGHRFEPRSDVRRKEHLRFAREIGQRLDAGLAAGESTLDWLAITRPNPLKETTMYKRILVPIDGSDPGRRGLKEAIALATEQKATLCLLHVTSDFPILLEIVNTIDFEKYRKGLQQYGRELLEDAKTLALDAGLEVETQLRDLKGGRVAAAIVDEAKKAACDLIVIGTHGRRGLSRALLGSDAESVLRESPVPVLLVRAPVEES